MTSTLGSPEITYTRGRLVIDDEDMALDLEGLLRLERLRLLDLRGEMVDAGVSEAVAMYDKRLARLKKLRARLEKLMGEKAWGTDE